MHYRLPYSRPQRSACDEETTPEERTSDYHRVDCFACRQVVHKTAREVQGIFARAYEDVTGEKYSRKKK
jgi:hypothetical protein